jgi:AcrR family transcriptional regulator
VADESRERADAARNRRAILTATEWLLAAYPAREISVGHIAATAGVGKATVFHRFGSRTGLMIALMIERARALEDAVTAGPPPLGPGASDRDRLLAFLAAVVEVVSRNKNLLAELASPAAAVQRASDAAADDLGNHPVYEFWHSHLTGLIAAGRPNANASLTAPTATERPDADASLTAHLLLGALHSEPVLSQLTDEGPERVTAALQNLALGVLNAAATPPPPPA